MISRWSPRWPIRTQRLGTTIGEVYRVFSAEERHGLKVELAWLKAAERSFEFWDDQEGTAYCAHRWAMDGKRLTRRTNT